MCRLELLEPRRVLAADPLPFVRSISLVDAARNSTARTWNVTFSEVVTGVDAADFKLTLSGVTATSPVTVSGSGFVYKVTAAGIAGNGTIGLNLVDDGTIRDATGNPLCSPTAVSFATPARRLSAGSGPIAVAVGDVNGDGKADLVAANSFDDAVGVLLGKGDGTFQPRRSFRCGSSPCAVALADFDADGKLDLVTANYFGDSVSVLLGNGDGGFGQPREFATGSRPVSVAIGFFDGNARPDLAVANNTDGTLGVLLGLGDGTFAPQRTFTTGRNPSSAVVTDFNADAAADVVTADFGDNAVSVLLGDGTGSLQPRQAYPANGAPWSVAIGDLNGDARVDVVMSNTSTGTLAIMLGLGNGAFVLQQQLAVGINPLDVVVADANADGRPDLVVTNTAGDTLGVLLGNGNGSFQPQRTFATGRSPRAVAFADFNGDRKPDAVTADFSSGTLSLFLGNVTGGFTGGVAQVDTVAPTVSIAAGASALRSGQTATITFTLSENSTTFGAADVVATGGTLSAFTGSGRSYRATFAPTAGSTAAGTITVAAGAFTDEAGNANLAASLAPPLVIDTVPPTVAITAAAGTLRPGQSTTITFTLSKPSRSFGLAVVAASGGRLSAFSAVSTTVFTATFTAGNGALNRGRIAVAAGRFTDAAGNGNVAGVLTTPIVITS